MKPGSRHKSIREAAISWFLRMEHVEAEHPDRSRFEAWLMADPAHQQAYAEVADLWQDFDSPAQLARLTDAMDQRDRLARERNAQRRKSLGKIAGILLLASASLFGFRSWQSQPVMQLAAKAEIGQLVSQPLEDGSSITLSPSSDVEIVYYRDKRLVKLKRGEVIFDVARDESRPFIVESGNAEVTVLGTRFAVNRLNKLVRVSVDHGSVRVGTIMPEGETDPAALVLTDGQVAEIAKQGKPSRVSRPAADGFGFAQGRINFDKTGLEEIAETLSRYRKPEVTVRQPLSRDASITAFIKVTDIEKFLTNLPYMAPVKVEQHKEYTELIGTEH
jgi:transmembrane sensor